MNKRTQFNTRTGEITLDYIDKLQEVTGENKSTIFRRAIRDYAEKHLSSEEFNEVRSKYIKDL